MTIVTLIYQDTYSIVPLTIVHKTLTLILTMTLTPAKREINGNSQFFIY